jgi:hypothetical protein
MAPEYIGVNPPPTARITTNIFLVGGQGDDITIQSYLHIQKVLTRAQALNLAAWIVAIADTNNEFEAILKAIREA